MPPFLPPYWHHWIGWKMLHIFQPVSYTHLIPYQFIPETWHYLFKNNQGLIGALDDKGEQLFSPTYQQLYHLNAQYYLAKKDDTYALIDSSTKNIIQSGFDSADFNDEIIQVTKNGQKYFYDYNCNPIELIYDSNKIADFLLQDNSKGMNADISKDGANSVRKNDEYIDNQDGTKNMIILIESNTGKKGAVLVSSKAVSYTHLDVYKRQPCVSVTVTASRISCSWAFVP